MLEPKGEGVTHIQKPRPGEFDVVLSSHPARRTTPAKSSINGGRVLVYLSVLAVAGWLLTSQLFTSKPQASTPQLAPAPGFAETQETPAAEPEAAVAQPVAQRIDISLPDPVSPDLSPAPAPAPKPLNNCLKQGNVIDQSVADCRFGESGKPDTMAVTPTSMVSAQYMADYKSGHNRQAAPRHKPYQLVTVAIREWDGRNAYRAQWRISDNVIDNDSVCDNFSEGSIERRECRRSAQVYFREECKDWGRRVGKNNDEPSKLKLVQYCTAAKTFSPQEG